MGVKEHHHSTRGNIDDRISEVIAFVVNAGMNITADNFFMQIVMHRLRGAFNLLFCPMQFIWPVNNDKMRFNA